MQQLQIVPATDLQAAAGAIHTSLAARPGDLMRVANLEGLPALLRPPEETVALSTVAPVLSKSDDLFGDSGLPSVAVIGTSFSTHSNFVPFMSQHLGAAVANFAKDGGDFDGAAESYFQSAAFRQEAPKALVWEVPERMLQQPLKDSERQWLARLRAGRL